MRADTHVPQTFGQMGLVTIDLVRGKQCPCQLSVDEDGGGSGTAMFEVVAAYVCLDSIVSDPAHHIRIKVSGNWQRKERQ